MSEISPASILSAGTIAANHRGAPLVTSGRPSMQLRRRPPLPEEFARAIERVRSCEPVVHLVANGVRGDSRVIKSALATIDEGLPTLVVGITGGSQYETFEAEGVPVLLVPYSSAELPTTENGTTKPSRAWQRREHALAAWRAGRAAASRELGSLGRVLRSTFAGDPAAKWQGARPTWLQINVAFADALDEIEPRMVHIHDSIPLPSAIAHAAGQRLRRRYVTTIYDAHECCPRLVESFPNSPMYQAMAAFEAEYIHEASQVITVSTEIADLITEHYGLAATPLVVTNCPNGERDPDAPDLRSEIGLAPDVPLAVYSGWVASERGLDTVLRAMPSLPELHLAIVVNSQTKELLDVLRLARTLGILDRVHTAPYVTPSQITQYLSSADVGLIPRKSGGHLDLSLPTKFREYAHAGLPLIVSDNAAMATEINRTKIGRVFKAGNVGGLSLQLGRVLESPERYRKRITPALLAEYAWETQTKVLRPLYAKASRKSDASGNAVVREALATLSSEPSQEETAEATQHSTENTWQHADARRYGVKLGIGRANSAGQAYAWANAVSTHLELVAQSFAPARASSRRPHVAVRTSYSIPQAATEFGRVVSEYTYLLVDGFTSMFGPLMVGDLEREIEALRPHMFGIGLIAHGSEIRDPDAHLAAVEGSYFAHAGDEWVDLLRGITTKNRQIAERFDGPLFVSTPDLLSDLPTAHWLPVVVDSERWSDLPPARFGQRLRVMHQPSRSDPPIKGTDVIHPVLERLDSEGVIEYLRHDGPVEAGDMPGLVQECDVLVDQIRTGSYGVAAVEAMSAGRVVVGSVSSVVRNEIGTHVPIVDAPPDDFEAAIRRLANTDRSELAEMATASQEFVSHWHDGRRSAQVIFDNLLDTTQ